MTTQIYTTWTTERIFKFQERKYLVAQALKC